MIVEKRLYPVVRLAKLTAVTLIKDKTRLLLIRSIRER